MPFNFSERATEIALVATVNLLLMEIVSIYLLISAVFTANAVHRNLQDGFVDPLYCQYVKLHPH